LSKIVIFHTQPASYCPLGGPSQNITTRFGTEYLDWCGYMMVKKFETIFTHLDTIHKYDRRTDRQCTTA